MKYYITTLVIMAVDQISKLLVRVNMDTGESIKIIGDFFKLTFVKNRGAAFSMFSGQSIFLIAVPLIAVIAAIIFCHKNKNEHPMMLFAICAIVAGGVGNLIDRISFGWVTDMFDFSIFPPVFNVADIAVVLGCAVLVLYVLIGDRLKKDEQ